MERHLLIIRYGETEGVGEIEGMADGWIFYKSKHGYLARMGWTLSPEKIAKSPKYVRTRELFTEFGYASRVGKLLRYGVKNCCSHVGDGDTNHRLCSAIVKAVRQDTVNGRGERRLMVDNVSLLQGFNWQARDTMGTMLRVPYSIALDVSAGSASLNIGALIPNTHVELPLGATHVELTLGLVALTAADNRWVHALDVSGMIPLNSSVAQAISLSCALPVGSGEVWMAGIGLQGYQLVGGQMMPLMDANGFEIGEVGV